MDESRAKVDTYFNRMCKQSGDPEYTHLVKMSKDHWFDLSYRTNNYFAYLVDLGKDPTIHLKNENFVPSYDPWCLYCGNKNARKRCSQCHSVYFCGRECQVEAWDVHQKHCERNLFTVCIACGSSDVKMKCPFCPVKFCGQKHWDSIYPLHRDYDCNYFAQVFGKGEG